MAFPLYLGVAENINSLGMLRECYFTKTRKLHYSVFC